MVVAGQIVVVSLPLSTSSSPSVLHSTTGCATYEHIAIIGIAVLIICITKSRSVLHSTTGCATYEHTAIIGIAVLIIGIYFEII